MGDNVMRWKNFSEWKAYATTTLIHLKQKYADNQKVVADLNYLLTKLHYIRSRDLSNFLLWVHTVLRDDGVSELLDIIPTKEEIIPLLRGE